MLRKHQSLFLGSCLLLLSALSCYAKPRPKFVVVWPSSGTPVLQFTIWKLDEIGTLQSERIYAVAVEAQNLSNKSIEQASFLLYLFDKDKARIGHGVMLVSNAAPGEVVKFQTDVRASGRPASVAVAPLSATGDQESPPSPRTVSMTVNSIPQGAHFTLDGHDEGETPMVIEVGVGTHMLEFTKEGFSPGKFPFAVGPNDASGASVSFQMGTSAYDTIDLRDGTVITGDLLSITATQVTVRVGGTVEQFDRNSVKRILLVQRSAPSGSPPQDGH
jgi:hypothetical protein